MSDRYPGGLIRKTPPTITPPVDGEGGSASGIWTMDQVAYYIKEGTWPQKVLPRELYAWGNNGSGRLGINTDETVDVSSPVQIGALTTWSQVAAADLHSVAVKTDGTLWVWGGNARGALGDNTVIARSSPIQIGALTTWSQVAAGDEFSAAVKTDGTLWAWGDGRAGQLGNNNVIDRSSPVQVGSLTTWSQVATGTGAIHIVALKTDGTIWAWGNNGNGRLGINTNETVDRSSPVQIGALTNWAHVSAGGQTSGAVKTDGTLWMWGRGGDGRVGDNTDIPRSSPVQIGSLTTWEKVEVNSTSHAIKTTGTLWGWGYNVNGQIGDNTTVPGVSSPVQIGSLDTWAQAAPFGAAVKTDGTLWTWGLNNSGQLGQNDEGPTAYRSSPVQVGAETNWSQASTGTYYVLATTKG